MAAHGALAGLFAAQSEAYSQLRPRYTAHLYDRILGWAGLAGQHAQRGLAVDLGCGSGQATADLAALFDRVVGVDASAEQLRHAPQLPNAEFRCRPVEATWLPDGCADLAVVATALHWFDLPAAYREMRRILKPSGALAAWAYSPWSGLIVPEDPSKADAVERIQRDLLQRFTPHIHPHLQRFMQGGYASYAPSSAEFAEVELETFDMQVPMTVQQVAGWVQSWSAFKPHCEQHGEAATRALLERYCEDLVAALGVPDAQATVRTRWPVHMLLARRPAPLPAGEQALAGGGAAGSAGLNA
ncbi:hypothetical protein ABPG75_009161 [Micractinium tetrahymenae]